MAIALKTMKLLSLDHASVIQHFAEFSAGLKSIPSLADHGFQDMVVLPGAFFIEMANVLHREIFQRSPSRIEDIEFVSPIILSAEDAIIEVEVTEVDTSVDYRFREKGGRGTFQSTTSQDASTLR